MISPSNGPHSPSESDRLGFLGVFKGKDPIKPYRFLFYPESLAKSVGHPSSKEDPATEWVTAAQEQISKMNKSKRGPTFKVSHLSWAFASHLKLNFFYFGTKLISHDPPLILFVVPHRLSFCQWSI